MQIWIWIWVWIWDANQKLNIQFIADMANMVKRLLSKIKKKLNVRCMNANVRMNDLLPQNLYFRASAQLIQQYSSIGIGCREKSRSCYGLCYRKRERQRELIYGRSVQFRIFFRLIHGDLSLHNNFRNAHCSVCWCWFVSSMYEMLSHKHFI